MNDENSYRPPEHLQQMNIGPNGRLVFDPAAQQASKKGGLAVLAIVIVLAGVLWRVSANSPDPVTAAPTVSAPQSPASANTASRNVAGTDERVHSQINEVLAAVVDKDDAALNLSLSRLKRLEKAAAPPAQDDAAKLKQARAAAARGDLPLASTILTTELERGRSARRVDALLSVQVAQRDWAAAQVSALELLLFNTRAPGAWRALGQVWARQGGDAMNRAPAALELSLILSPSQRARAVIRKDALEHADAGVRTAALQALRLYYLRLLDPAVAEHLPQLGAYPYAVFVPARIPRAMDGSALFVIGTGPNAPQSDAKHYKLNFGTSAECTEESCVAASVSAQPGSLADGEHLALEGGMEARISQDASGQQLVAFAAEGTVVSVSAKTAGQATAIANMLNTVGPLEPAAFKRAQEMPAATPSTVGGCLTPKVCPVFAPVGPAQKPDVLAAQLRKSVVLVTAGANLGSGVVISPEVVVTNCHVLGTSAPLVRFQGTAYGATVLASTDFDLCVLEVPGLPAQPVHLARASELVEGQRVYSLGNPGGFELTFAEGLVSGIRTKEGVPLPIIQTSAPISHGSSGGGLFDEYGRLVGITTFLIRDTQNINFALPAELVKNALAGTAASSAHTALRKTQGEFGSQAFVRPALAPNGETWPVIAGYVRGYTQDSRGGHSTISVDNARGSSDVFVRVYSMTGINPVRHFYIPIGQNFTAEDLRAGPYQVRFLSLATGTAQRTNTIQLEESDSSATTYTVTLYTVPGGNLRPIGIPLSEF